MMMNAAVMLSVEIADVSVIDFELNVSEDADAAAAVLTENDAADGVDYDYGYYDDGDAYYWQSTDSSDSWNYCDHSIVVDVDDWHSVNILSMVLQQAGPCYLKQAVEHQVVAMLQPEVEYYLPVDFLARILLPLPKMKILQKKKKRKKSESI